MITDITTALFALTIGVTAGDLFGNTPAILLGIALLSTGLLMRPTRECKK